MATAFDQVVNRARVRRTMVTVGASVGGVKALTELFRDLPPGFQASMAVVLHRAPHIESRLAQVLGRFSTVPVLEPADGDPLQPGHVYVAPRDRHLLVEAPGVLRLDGGPREHFTRPAVDPLMRSAAAAFGRATVGVVLTGGGSDGVAGLLALHAAGGIALVQDPDEAVGRSMPWMSILKDHVDAVLPLNQFAPVLAALAAGEAVDLSGREWREAQTT